VRAVIAAWRRSPFTRAHKGELTTVRPDELIGQVAMKAMHDSELPPQEIDDILIGCAYPEGEQGYNIGRLSAFLGGLDHSVPGATINRLCGSSMQAILTAAANIRSGWGDCFVCGGVESMSRVKRRGFNWSPHPNLVETYPEAYVNMGITAENVARMYGISREDQELFALESHKKATKAVESGHFDDEIVKIVGEGFEVNSDSCIRPGTSLESMSGLSPAFVEDGSVTAATSSPLTDGAVIAIVCSEAFADAHDLEPIASISGGAVTGVPPELMGIGPVTATRLLLNRVDWQLSDVDVIELNEAFSSQSLACIRELGIDEDIVNIDGGALAIGHPLGASGARIACKAASLMSRTGGKRAVATMCIGGGMGIAIALEAI
jgi:acetyl-CoA acyltransferase